MGGTRSGKAFFGTIAGFTSEIVTVVCGLILPRLVLSYFGSAYNGITSSVSQFIACISLAKAGVGGVTRAALYKPLAERDVVDLSAIMNGTKKYMRKIAIIFTLLVLVFAAIYPIWINTEFSWLFSFSLFLVMASSLFVQYYFSLAYEMLLVADQKQGVLSCIQAATEALSTITAAVLICLGATIHVVKAGSAVVLMLQSLFLSVYVHKHYTIDKKIEPNLDRIKQRWDAFGHEIANFVNSNTDVMILTIFLGMKEVSVYTVYMYAVSAVRRTVSNFVIGFDAAFGDMYARKEYELMEENFRVFEVIVFSLTSVMFSVALVMITPFALLYTTGVTDVNYERPLFGFLLVVAGAFTCFRFPYYSIATALGHYRETRNGAYFEAILNIVISLICVSKLGLVGVTIGTLVAAVFRSCQYAYYVGKHILPRSIMGFVWHVLATLGIMLLTFLLGIHFMPNAITLTRWIYKSIVITILAAALTLGVDFVFWKDDLRRALLKMARMLRFTKGEPI